MANELEIREMARKLNLYNIARLETYQTDLSPVDYLSFLLQYEIDERKRRSVENNRRLSRLPKSSDREEFNGITKWMITKLQKCEWIEEESNLVISGKCGTGKTALATMLGDEGEYFDILINHEILGIDPWEEEWPSHIYNFVELPCYCILNLPYLILGVRLFKNIIQAATTKLEKIKYTLLPLCALTMLPCYALKIDFGRWVFAGTAYFALVILALVALKDKIITQQLHALMEDIKARYAYAHLLLIYVVTMIPLYDIHINQITRVITDWLDATFFHIL